MAALSDEDRLHKLRVSLRKLKDLRSKPNIYSSILLGPTEPLSIRSPAFLNWQQDTIETIKLVFGEHSRFLDYFNEITYNNPAANLLGDKEGKQRALDAGLNQAESLLEKMIEQVFGNTSSRKSESGVLVGGYGASPPLSHKPCVFIGHGRSPLWARLKIFLQDDLGLETVTYESEARAGESIVPILEGMLKNANFAVLILTAEDETAQGSKRARQNVIHEAGLFQGRLGFKKAVLLVQEGIEDFSNVAGLQNICFTGDRIDQTFYELQRVLRREDLI